MLYVEMNVKIANYWKEKTEKTKNIFPSWNKGDEIAVRRLIVSKIMEIPIDGISYYLKKCDWLKDFVSESLEPEVCLSNAIIEKANKVIAEVFYSEDCKKLYHILNKESKGNLKKKDVCDAIKELVVNDKYDSLTEQQKDIVDTLEKVYFEPIELLNPYIEEKASTEVYYTILMEQWKTANEMAAQISAQRNSMNNFYMSLMSILIGGILFSDQLLNANDLSKMVLFITIAVVGFACCNKWIAQINNYGKLNSAKYDIINELEKSLPANIMLCEYKRTEKNARKSKVKINFSEQERSIACLFRIVVLVVPTIMILGTWWDDIWKLIETVLNSN